MRKFVTTLRIRVQSEVVFTNSKPISRTHYLNSPHRTKYLITRSINIFGILLSWTEIELYLWFSIGFGSKHNLVWFQINRKMVYTICFRYGLTWFQKDFHECRYLNTGTDYRRLLLFSVVFDWIIIQFGLPWMAMLWLQWESIPSIKNTENYIYTEKKSFAFPFKLNGIWL